MKAEADTYYNLVERIEDDFSEIDSSIIVDLRKNDSTYLSLCQQCDEMERTYPYLLEIIEGEGEISLTKEEHEILVKYFSIVMKKDDMERRRIYFRGHTDGYVYLKKIGAV